MKPHTARVLAALNRNFAEANEALLQLTAYQRLNEAGISQAGVDFLAIAAGALYDGMIGGAIRIFDNHKEAGSLWYIIRCHRAIAQLTADRLGISLEQLRGIVPRLLHIRNKTHFHIDRKALDNPATIWSDAGITVEGIAAALLDAARLLAGIKQAIYGGDPDQLTPYDGADVTAIVAAWRAARAE
ncbi:hypothetical protein SAMN06265795_10873 [Noviherbaspirillum humi]|uniref:HEPN AbiU2-like domain-containing protein n=1 Tax=Noviherbaspirillum humi TaxID=1688639 RepID=A0A239I3B6_9BURK|nr:hypothetical protein [Noviherbaspirillum humi]SNS87573.1 hypothetical protein SAMN06265795_10873 [Noviherbaspirillum humi]